MKATKNVSSRDFAPIVIGIKIVSKALLSLIILMFFLGCQNKTFESDKDLMAYIQEESNGYIYYKTVNGVDFNLMYRPTDLLVQQELGDSMAEEQIQALREKYSQYLYFNLSMSKGNKELLSAGPRNRNEFGQMVNQLVFGMNDKVHLYTKSKDTLELIDFVYPRMYGMSRATTIMFVYPRSTDQLNETHLNFTIEDLGLSTGEVKFKIPTKIIKTEPKLRFQH